MTNISKYNNSYEIVDTYNLNFPYMTSDIKDMNLYILYQVEESDEYGGKMGAFDISTGEKLKEINIPKEENKVQNLIVN
jgi:hypothetical protein